VVGGTAGAIVLAGAGLIGRKPRKFLSNSSTIHYSGRMIRLQLLLPVAAAFVSVAASPSAHVTDLRLACSDGVETRLILRGGTAEVRRGGKRYLLRERPTSFTRKFESPEATLIQDGQSVVFASGNASSAADCKIMQP
jgi:hypothetical protein